MEVGGVELSMCRLKHDLAKKEKTRLCREVKIKQGLPGKFNKKFEVGSSISIHDFTVDCCKGKQGMAYQCDQHGQALQPSAEYTHVQNSS